MVDDGNVTYTGGAGDPAPDGTGRYHLFRALFAAALVMLLVAGAVPLVDQVPHVVRVVAGHARPADRLGESDEDQIRDTLASISDSYNRQDVRSAQQWLCSPARSQWDSELERVWLRFRLEHGVMRFTVESITVDGTVADVVGIQHYANDAAPKPFTAKLGRSPHGWKMCSST